MPFLRIEIVKKLYFIMTIFQNLSRTHHFTGLRTKESNIIPSEPALFIRIYVIHSDRNQILFMPEILGRYKVLMYLLYLISIFQLSKSMGCLCTVSIVINGLGRRYSSFCILVDYVYWDTTFIKLIQVSKYIYIRL